jgi:hypothetical protein
MLLNLLKPWRKEFTLNMLNFITYFSGSMAYMAIIWMGLLSKISNMKSTNKHVKEKCKKKNKEIANGVD